MKSMRTIKSVRRNQENSCSSKADVASAIAGQDNETQTFFQHPGSFLSSNWLRRNLKIKLNGRLVNIAFYRRL